MKTRQRSHRQVTRQQTRRIAQDALVARQIATALTPMAAASRLRCWPKTCRTVFKTYRRTRQGSLCSVAGWSGRVFRAHERASESPSTGRRKDQKTRGKIRNRVSSSSGASLNGGGITTAKPLPLRSSLTSSSICPERTEFRPQHTAPETVVQLTRLEL